MKRGALIITLIIIAVLFLCTLGYLGAEALFESFSEGLRDLYLG